MQPQLHTPGWGCQHTLRASNNVVIDVLTCGYDTADEATHVVDDIDAKLPSV
jgi:S-adenosylmethionine/arginine decarboxylase-like enzyme